MTGGDLQDLSSQQGGAGILTAKQMDIGHLVSWLLFLESGREATDPAGQGWGAGRKGARSQTGSEKDTGGYPTLRRTDPRHLLRQG